MIKCSQKVNVKTAAIFQNVNKNHFSNSNEVNQRTLDNKNSAWNFIMSVLIVDLKKYIECL